MRRMYTSAQLLVIARDYRQRAETAPTAAQAGVWRALALEFERDAARLSPVERYDWALAAAVAAGLPEAPARAA